MKLCKVEVINGVISCAACGVPFTGPFALSEADLAAIGNDLSKVHRPCATGTGTGRAGGYSVKSAAASTTVQTAADRPAGAMLADYRQCRHRGGVVRSERCSTCRGNVQVKVFACAIHGQCQLSGRVVGVKTCGPGCQEHAAPTG
jgi:hypothetical protein